MKNWQCLQTSLAAGAVLSSELEVTARTPLVVRHEQGESLLVHCEAACVWARQMGAGAPVQETIRTPVTLRPSLEEYPTATVLRQARGRIHLHLPDPRTVEAVDLDPEQVLAACRETGTHGVVLWSAAGAGRLRVRVFTTSLGGAEDTATGGAVLGVARLLGADGARGEYLALQGPGDVERQGHLRIRIGDDGVLLGGEVLALMSGELRAQ
ncbi:PhzF family phenazine biosynthesis protein [Glycomyces xiaoerkulensis]|uniref:PhzF family phenazine biosynthesis protein n=1 Tax=Glycomyces xiaoerkulensis TaxID=2038139 RepID=UPI000C26055E|nr:PhzF family phenazine biosynthesis protein [Glycomyces xiaoerkulensis]